MFKSVEDWSRVVEALPVEFRRECPFEGVEGDAGTFNVTIPTSHIDAVEEAMEAEVVSAIE